MAKTKAELIEYYLECMNINLERRDALLAKPGYDIYRAHQLNKLNEEYGIFVTIINNLEKSDNDR